MCGITGFIHQTGDQIDTRSALSLLKHRGPDAHGQLSVGFGARTVWLGHTRLAIQDLTEAGAQPLTTADSRWAITFNGEIYNHMDLRASLQRDWRGHSDTETLAEAISQWGVEQTVRRLNGIFAFAALDRQTRKLYLIRDPFGVKPLYFATTPRGFGFASEIRSLAAVTGQRFKVDSDSLSTFLSLRFVPSPETMLAGVSRLPPGHLSCSDIDTGESTTLCYTPHGNDRFSGSLEEATRAYRESVSKAVKRQLLSDVPVGILLSGGIDSALVAAMALDAGVKAPCFTVGYDDGEAACEIDDAAHTAKVLGLPHHVVRVGHEDLWQALELAVHATEEPLVTTSALPMWFLCQRARQDVTAVLTGQGSDELLGGYRRYQGELVREIPFFQKAISLARPLLDRLPGVPDHVLRSAQSAGIANVVERFESAYCVFTGKARQNMLGRAEAPGALRAIRRWLDWAASGRSLTPIEQMMAIDLRLGLADDLLLYGDKVSMAHSLEARVPLLDTELVNLVESMPVNYKVAMSRSKIVHKRMAERYLPDSIVHRPKKGFHVPIRKMLKGAWRERCEAILFDADGLAGLGLDRKVIRTLWDEHQGGFYDRSREVFALLSLAIWKHDMRDVIDSGADTSARLESDVSFAYA